MNKAYKFRIYPDERQRDLFSKTFGCVRLVYNKMLEDKIAYYNDTGKTLNNTPAQHKTKYPFLAEVDSLALANAQLHLQTAYANFFRDPKIGFPKFKSKHTSWKAYTTNCVNSNIALANGLLKLPKAGHVKIKQHRTIPDNYVLKSVTVSQSPDGKYYASILFEYDNQIQEKLLTSDTSAIGLDFSMHGLYKDSEGNEPEYPRYYR